MKCTLDTIKNNQWMAGSLAAVGLTGAGMVAHRLGLFALCPKGVSDACGYVAAVVSRHRFASVVLAFAAVGMICLAAVPAVLRTRKGDAPDSSQPRQASASVTPEARLDQLLLVEGNIEWHVQNTFYPSVFSNTKKYWNPKFENIRQRGEEDKSLKEMIVTVLTSYVNGEEIPFCEFFDPDYLTIKDDESNQAQSTQIQQSQLSIFPASVETQRMIEYGELLQEIITYYVELNDQKALPGDSFSYRFEITVGDKKNISVGHRNLG